MPIQTIPDTQSLWIFVTVFEQLSVSKAARILKLSQPAVSKRITCLEKNLGTQLFSREGKKLAATPAGTMLFPYAKELIEKLYDFTKRAEDNEKNISGRLSMGTSHHIGLYYLPQILKRFTEIYPDVEVDIAFLDTDRLKEAVISMDLDFALGTLFNIPEAQIEQITYWQDRLQVCVGHQHPLAKKDTASLETLATYQAILPSQFTYTYQEVSSLFKENNLLLQARIPTNQLQTIKMLVEANLGWSVLPENIADDKVKRLKVPGFEISRELGLMKRKNMVLSQAAKAFLRLIR